MPRLLAALLALLALPPLVACDTDSEAQCREAAAEAGILEIGTGEFTFTPVADGDRLTVYWGPQGGQHIWGSLRATGIVGETLNFDADMEPVVTFQIFVEEEHLAGYSATPRFFTRRDGSFELVGETLFVDYYSYDTGGGGFDGFDGVEARMVARVEDACGRVLTAERTVTLAD
jgi:hypothetical protein